MKIMNKLSAKDSKEKNLMKILMEILMKNTEVLHMKILMMMNDFGEGGDVVA